MIYLAYTVCCFGFIFLTAFAVSIFAGPATIEQDANGIEPLTPEDLAGMELIEQPNELGRV